MWRPIFGNEVLEMNASNLPHTHVTVVVYNDLQQPHEMLRCILKLHKNKSKILRQQHIKASRNSRLINPVTQEFKSHVDTTSESTISNRIQSTSMKLNKEQQRTQSSQK